MAKLLYGYECYLHPGMFYWKRIKPIAHESFHHMQSDCVNAAPFTCKKFLCAVIMFSIYLKIALRNLLRNKTHACIIAFPFAYNIAESSLSDYAFRVDLNLIPFVLVAVSAIIIALLSVSYRAIKATSVNLVNSIKYE